MHRPHAILTLQGTQMLQQSMSTLACAAQTGIQNEVLLNTLNRPRPPLIAAGIRRA